MRLSSLFLAGVVLVPVASAAHAADWYTGQESPARADDWIVAVDGSATIASKSNFEGLSVTAAPLGSLSRNGFRLRLEGLIGTYSYFAQQPVFARINSDQQTGAVSAGYEWKSRNTSVALYGGVIVQNVNLSQPDPNNSVVGTGVGAKFSGEFYTRPTPDMMIQGYGSYATLHNAYYTRLKLGWAVWGNDLFLGPEASALGDDFYQQVRIGAHLSGIRVGPLQFGIAGGYLKDKNEGSGAYGILDARTGF